MGKHTTTIAPPLFLLLHMATLLVSLACPSCPTPTPPPPPNCPPIPKLPPPHPYPKPPFAMPPPTTPKPPVVTPPNIPKLPPIVIPTPPHDPNPPVPKLPPPVVTPPIITKPPPVVTPPYLPPSPPKETPCPPPKAHDTCPIDALKLDACVDVLGGLIHIGIGSTARETCCPLLEGLVDLDAAICLCTTIKAKVLNISIILPIALQVLVNECGKNPPPGFQCPP